MVKTPSGEWQYVDLDGMQGHGSDTTKMSSTIQRFPTITVKKVLQFKVFKSLKECKDVKDKYIMGKLLGKGSFGEVYSCKHAISGDEFAIKIVKKSKVYSH